MRNYRSSAAVVSAVMLALSGAALADDAAAPAKPAGPSLSDVLTTSGITVSGYVDASYAYMNDQTTSTDYNTFALQQAALTISYLPTSGFGALANVLAGANPYNGVGIQQASGTNVDLYLLQAYAQYAAGPLTLQAGKFLTLEGVEAVAPVLNTNTTRSILWGFEPVTHTGVRATYAVNDKLNLIVGVNNGVSNQNSSDGSDKTLEAGLAFTPNKMISWTLQGYYGRDYINWSSQKANIALVDTVLTWNATSALSLVGSIDYGNVASTGTSPSADWYGIAAYANYAINDNWRASLRAEYFDDEKGYETIGSSLEDESGVVSTTYSDKLKEVTLTFGYDPTKNVEVRLEGRYDFPSTINGTQYEPKTYQGWLEAYYKFASM